MSLSRDEEYGKCPQCSHVFVISLFNRYPTCNYDGRILVRIGQVYPKNTPAGDRDIIWNKE